MNPDSDFTNAWTPLQTKIQLAKSTYATYLGELSKVYYTAGDWTTELTTDGHLWADLGGGTKKCDPATATAGTPANQANAAACKAACLTAGFHAVYVPA